MPALDSVSMRGVGIVPPYTPKSPQPTLSTRMNTTLGFFSSAEVGLLPCVTMLPPRGHSNATLRWTRSLHKLDLARRPGLDEERHEPIQAQERELTFAGYGLDPVAAIHAVGLLRSGAFYSFLVSFQGLGMQMDPNLRMRSVGATGRFVSSPLFGLAAGIAL